MQSTGEVRQKRLRHLGRSRPVSTDGFDGKNAPHARTSYIGKSQPGSPAFSVEAGPAADPPRRDPHAASKAALERYARLGYDYIDAPPG